MIPYSLEANQLLIDGAVALSQIESNGMMVDTQYLDTAIRRTRRKIEYLEEELEHFEEMKTWKKTFGNQIKLGSHEQLGKVLFEVMNYESQVQTEGGGYSTDEEALRALNLPFIQKFLDWRHLNKALSTYLIGFQKHVAEDGCIHPSFNLNLVISYRSSSDSPNFQNIPVRNKEIQKLVRSMFKARPGRRIVEIDFSGAEVRCSACHNKDPKLIQYITDPTTDMHRDMAELIYMVSREEVTKDIRYCAKNKYVFPAFYGSVYFQVAKDLWDAIPQLKLTTKDGKGLREHLKVHGIDRLGLCDPQSPAEPGTFEAHLQGIDSDFWNKRFVVYKNWKEEWYREYRRKGWFQTPIGFVCQGYMKRNEVLNLSIQGTAFWWLMWSLIELQKELNKRKMKSLIVGQIHDSIVADIPEDEFEIYCELARDIIERRLPEHWKWIIVPIECDIEASPIDGTWYQKDKIIKDKNTQLKKTA